eukprot:TRINITY_DN14588_c0_g1_i1.p2 TRINITY_DN14588_c0_g1~~TRINITY_DN14588_c0_g1_i1.p2  ORF type:complete len:205 (+),score=19.45 TRINITY_DN14588_c0_g1_i1:24-617(+)
MFPKIFKNIYFLTGVLFVLWMAFFDGNNILNQFKLNQKVVELEEQKKYYEEGIVTLDKDMEELSTSAKKLEKFVREKYLFKKKGEDIYLIEEKNEEQFSLVFIVLFISFPFFFYPNLQPIAQFLPKQINGPFINPLITILGDLAFFCVWQIERRPTVFNNTFIMEEKKRKRRIQRLGEKKRNKKIHLNQKRNRKVQK